MKEMTTCELDGSQKAYNCQKYEQCDECYAKDNPEESEEEFKEKEISHGIQSALKEAIENDRKFAIGLHAAQRMTTTQIATRIIAAFGETGAENIAWGINNLLDKSE